MSRTKREFIEDAAIAMMGGWVSSYNGRTSEMNTQQIVEKAAKAWRNIEIECPPDPRPEVRAAPGEQMIATSIARLAAVAEKVTAEPVP